MLRKTLLALMLLSTVVGAWAQDERPYKPLIREGCRWIYRYSFTDELVDQEEMYELFFNGDTIISGIKYTKLYAHYQFSNYPEVLKVAAYMREENKQVFAINPTEQVLDLVTWKYSQFEGPYFEQTGEYIVFDFGDPDGFARKAYGMRPESNTRIYIDEDTTFLGEIRMKIIEGYLTNNIPTKLGLGQIEWNNYNYIIEGIGYFSGNPTNNFLKPAFVHTWPRTIYNYTINLCHIIDENGEIEYALWLPTCGASLDGLTWEEYEALPGCYSYVRFEDYLREKGFTSVNNLHSQTTDIEISTTPDEICITLSSDIKQGIINVYSIDGKLIKSVPICSNRNSIPTRNFTPGVYVVQYTDPFSHITRKVEVK